MAVSLTTNIDKIVFTSPNMPSPQAAGLRSHIVPSETDLGLWFESGGTMIRAAMAQNIYDISYNTGIDRPVFGLSGIVTPGTLYIEGQNNNIYIDTNQTWSLSFPRNVYVDDNSWFTAISMSEYSFANSPPSEDSFLDNAFTSSGTLTSTRNITINGCAVFMEPYNYIFNTNALYKYDPATKQYTLVKQCSYDVSYPTTMVGVSGTLYMFYLDTDNLLIKGIEYNTSTETWATNANYEYQSSASSLTAINAVYVDDTIMVTFKYSENSIPSNLYIYNYNHVFDSWTSTFIATCGSYNLDFNNALIEADSNYLYSLERSSKLLHKIDLNTKVDDQMITRYETTDKSSAILKGTSLYTYVGSSNQFTKININTETITTLSVPTISGTDSTLSNESTTLSTNGTDLYLSLNKGVTWDSQTKLYKYTTSTDAWTEITVPKAGSVRFDGKMCRYENNIYGTDDENLYKYDTTNDKWITLSALPRADAFDSVIAANATHLYIVISECGYFWRCDLTTNTWEILQSISLPAPLSYEGTCPGSLLIDNDTIYLGLYYNYVLSTRDTFFYKYDIVEETWTTYTAPKTSANRSFYMYIYDKAENVTFYFSEPKGITVDNVYLYIADTNNNKILKKLKSDLSQVAQIGSLGTSDDRFNLPEGITSDDTYLYIADTGNSRVVKRLKINLNYNSKIGTFGTGNDQFKQPKGITNDSTYIYIADTENNRIVKRLKSNLSFVSKIGSQGDGQVSFTQPMGVTVDNIYIYITDTQNGSGRTLKLLKSDKTVIIKDGPYSGHLPEGITSDNTYLYITDTGTNEIKKQLKSDLSINTVIGFYGGTQYYYFSQPYDITVDDTYMYIAEAGNNELVKIRKSDKFLITVKKRYTSGAYQFSYPYGITSDDTHVFFTNTGYSEIAKLLKSDLSYVSKIGSHGSFNDNFDHPGGITCDNDYLYIADTGNNRIVKRYKSNLSYISKIGSQGNGNDQFYSPAGITCDDTYIYISDTLNHRIVKRLKSNLSFVSKIGSQGSGNDQFYQPGKITCKGSYLYVSDTKNNRIVKRNTSDLNYVSKTTEYTGSPTGNYNSPRGITCDGDYVYVFDTNNHMLVTISGSDLSHISHINSLYNPSMPNKAKGLACDDTYLYVANTNGHEIVKRLKSDLSYVSKIGSQGNGDDQFSSPNKITCDDTYIYISDTLNHRIVKRLKSNLSFVSKIGSQGSGNDQFDSPKGICTYSGSSYVYVSDTNNNRIVKRNKSDLSYSSEFTSYNSINYNRPIGITCYEDYIYLLDTDNNTLVTTSGSNINYISHINSAYDPNQFDNPKKITCDDTYLYVSDTGNNRISKRLKSDLSYISKIGTFGTGNDQFDSPEGIIADNTHLYITDTNNNRIIKRLKTNLSYVSKTETYDSISFSGPGGITTYDGTDLYVLDTNNNTLVTLSGSNLSYLSKISSWPAYSSIIHLAGDIAYTGSPVDTYTYRDYMCTDTVNNTWTETKAVTINAMSEGKYVCMYGQTFINNKIYINFTTATNLGFSCSGPLCRQIDVSSGTSNYWTINPSDERHFVIEDSTGAYIYCASVDTGILYKYTITSTSTTAVSIPRQAFVNYYIHNYNGNNYLFGKQEIEYDPSLYRYNFYVYKDNAGTWDQYDLQQNICASGSLKLNTIQEYYTHNNIVYMTSFIRSTENTNVSEAIHKKYNIPTKTFDNLNMPTLTTSITASGSGNDLLLAVGNEIKTYNISTDATETFQQGIAGNRASAFPYIYKNGGKLYATSNQYFTPEAGGKFVTYEEAVSGSWSIIDSKDISATFYNTLDYAEKNNELYIINTAEQMTLNLTTLAIEYISNAPYSTIGTVTSGGIILYNDHYACKSYIYNSPSFIEIPSDVVRTHKSSNLLFVDETMYFTKNSVTNEISTINVVSGTRTILYDNAVMGDTPFFCNVNSSVYMLQPEYQTLSTISGSNVNTVKTNLDINNHTSACSNGTDTIYFTKGENYYLFYKFLISSGTLTQLPNLPEYSTNYSSIEYYDNKVYYITSNKMYLFDTQNETWDSSITLQNQIYSKGIKIDPDYIYYCGNTNVCKVDRNRPETKPISLSPIPARHHSAYCLNGTDIYLQYNTINLISECTAIIGEEKITTFSLNNISHQTPSAVPYNLQLISNIEKTVEFSWSVSSTTNITHYRIYRTRTLNENLIYVGKSTTLSFIDTLADRGITYYYYVKACNEWGGTSSFSNCFQINVAGYSYKYALTVSNWENRVKEINQLPTSSVYIWGNSNLSFTNTVRVNITHGEAYNCYLTAWDDDSHSSTSNKLLSNECFKVAAVVFSTKQDSTLEEPDIKAMMCKPQFDKILKGNDSYYGKFNVIYEAQADRYGGYIIFKPVLVNIPEEQLTKGVYLFKAVLHYQYT